MNPDTTTPDERAPDERAPDDGAHAWETAALRLLDDPYVFAAAGPRTHADWAEDALAVLRRESADPRGWTVLDWDRDGEERAAGDPSFPFLPGLTATALHTGLHPLDAPAAADLLASFTQEWTFETAPLHRRPAAELEAVREDARTLLRRFGAGAETTYWTTSALARPTTAPDFLQGPLSGGGARFTDYAEELGLIVAAPAEVGVFWSFNAI
ncbi:hypothetical protein [Streptomyces sp. G-G2]|uniref:hypothetical protein n=1 Tax=Streptomyces sp. G-G2 TaxID=3046201 RepID=UPI0024BBDB1E|nr:hypothetical protein [Streptomyces sp. G-G2]MDJ0385515.1 hypothetical protein [Streptomyces sp. G-G2]